MFRMVEGLSSVRQREIGGGDLSGFFDAFDSTFLDIASGGYFLFWNEILTLSGITMREF